MARLRAMFVLSCFAAAVLFVNWFLEQRQVPEAPANLAVFSALTASSSQQESHPSSPAPQKPVPQSATYIEVASSCGPYYAGTCLNARAGPGTQYPSVLKLRKGMVLRVGDTVQADGRIWYKIVFDEWLRYPERVTSDMYVAADYITPVRVTGEEDETAAVGAVISDKYIIVDRTKQMLYAYEGKKLFMEQAISTGLDLTPTPRGIFSIYRKTPTRYMQGPIPGLSDQEYDLPGVPWDLYFTPEGGAIHGAYWHNHFGEPWSHGCVNLPPEKAKELYDWAPVGTKVIVRD